MSDWAASGHYGRLEGLFFSQVRLDYVYTSPELGYSNEFTDNWICLLSVNRTFYAWRVTRRDSVLRNELENYTQYALCPVALGLDYNFLFDRFNAHTLAQNLAYRWKKRID